MTFCEVINFDNLVKSLSEVYMSGGHHACGVTGVTPPPGEVNPPHASGVAPTPVPPMAGLLDELFASPSTLTTS
jgi:hypothetical protein